MLELLEYFIAIGGSIVIFLITKLTNLGVTNFPLYICLLAVWSIVMFILLHLVYKAKVKHQK